MRAHARGRKKQKGKKYSSLDFGRNHKERFSTRVPFLVLFFGYLK